MSEDDLVTASERDPLARIYDFFKHLMTLSLFSIGGVFGLIGGKNGDNITTPMILLIVGLFGLAAWTGLSGLTTITSVELKQEPVDAKLLKKLLMHQTAGMTLLSIAVGAFLYAFLKVLP